MAELTKEPLTSRFPSRRAPTVNCGATARASVNVKLAVATATCATQSPDVLRRLARANWLAPISSHRLARADWFTPTGPCRLAHFNCHLLHDYFLCFRSSPPIRHDPSPRLSAPCLKPAPNPRRARGLLMGIHPRGSTIGLTRQGEEGLKGLQSLGRLGSISGRLGQNPEEQGDWPIGPCD